MRTKTVLTADDAATIIAAARAEAERHGWAMSIAVVDDAGHLLGFVRLDGAGYGTIDIARRKAETSALTRRPSAETEQVTLDRLHLLALGDRLPIRGGWPAIKDGECVGAVGASGAASPQDEQVARAGLAAIGLD